MSPEVPLFKPVIEPLDRQKHDRAAFHCGVESLDRYFHRQAGQDLARGLAVPYVLVEPQSMKVAGYYTLTNYRVDVGELPPEITRRIPYTYVPATLIGRLAIDLSYQGKGLGEVLLRDALGRSLENSHRVASLAVVVDAIDDSASNFYQRYGFVPLPAHPDRLFLTMATILRLVEG